MGGHDHGGHGHDHVLDPRVRKVLLWVILPMVAATVVGLIALRPSGDLDLSNPLGDPGVLFNGTVVDQGPSFCDETAPPPTAGQPDDRQVCSVLDVRLTSGPSRGDTVTIPLQGVIDPIYDKGDDVILGFIADAADGQQYFIQDFQRRTPLLWLALLFSLAVVVLGRFRGLSALAGLVVSLAVLVWFVLPAILQGESPLGVAIVGSAAIMLVALYLAHGFSARTTAAAIGTLASLALTGVLGAMFVAATHLTGLTSEEATFLQAFSDVNVQGLILAGIVIGSLGVLDDVTVTQVSAVWELHAADPGMPSRSLYTAGLRIGRDHIASTVNTLVLAYAGASLPLLVLFSQSGRGLGDVIGSEVVAIEVVRTLVGSIGLVASVPITTALAAWVVTGSRPVSDVADAVHSVEAAAVSGPSRPRASRSRSWLRQTFPSRRVFEPSRHEQEWRDGVGDDDEGDDR
ncbi:MAG TPA: YibE/F family protein [Acidimicrobiales bacterium]|nr:YibE/F family protein [Acidimicrobiales bacterium]